MAKSFSDLSVRSQLVVFAMLSVLVVVGAWQVLIGPAREDLSTRASRLSMLQGEVARAQATADKLAAFERDVRALEIALKQTTAVLPDEKDPQDVLRNLHELASETALDLSSFTPKPIAIKTQYSEWPIQLGLEGGYHDLGRFFDRVATMSRLVSVSDLNIKTNIKPNSRSTITASCVATTFVYKKDIAPGAPSAALAASVIPAATAVSAAAGGAK
jgi:type IV pilus assembly protein PilO